MSTKWGHYRKFKLFEKAKPKTIYRNIVGGDAKIYFGPNTVKLKFNTYPGKKGTKFS